MMSYADSLARSIVAWRWPGLTAGQVDLSSLVPAFEQAATSAGLLATPEQAGYALEFFIVRLLATDLSGPADVLRVVAGWLTYSDELNIVIEHWKPDAWILYWRLSRGKTVLASESMWAHTGEVPPACKWRLTAWLAPGYWDKYWVLTSLTEGGLGAVFHVELPERLRYMDGVALFLTYRGAVMPPVHPPYPTGVEFIDFWWGNRVGGWQFTDALKAALKRFLAWRVPLGRPIALGETERVANPMMMLGFGTLLSGSG